MASVSEVGVEVVERDALDRDRPPAPLGPGSGAGFRRGRAQEAFVHGASPSVGGQSGLGGLGELGRDDDVVVDHVLRPRINRRRSP